MDWDLVPIDELLESDDSWQWNVQIIQSGTSKNRTHYPQGLLSQIKALYEGVPVFVAGETGHPTGANRGVRNLAGWLTNIRENESGLVGVLQINRGMPAIRETIAQAWDVFRSTGRLSLGFSHVVPPGKFQTRVARNEQGDLVREVTSITEVDSVDLVMRPSAGGQLLGIVEAVEVDGSLLMNLEELLRRLQAGETLTAAEMATLAREAPTQLAEALEAQEDTSQDDDPPATTGVTEDVTDPVSLDNHPVVMAANNLLIGEALRESHLPQDWQDAIREEFSGRVIDQSELEARIARDRRLAASLIEASGSSMPFSGTIEVTDDQRDKWDKAMDGFFAGADVDGVTRFRSLKEAYLQVSGNPRGYSYIDPQLAREILGETAMYVDPHNTALREAIVSTTFGEMWGDSITRRMLAEYNHPQYGDWRFICSDIGPVNDFRTQRRMRWGGYGDLPVVSEGDNYQPLTSPTDEEATWSTSKRGGTEELTFEAVTNDDVGVIRRIPGKLGVAAAHTLYTQVFVTTIVDNPAVTYGGLDTLFHANHSNTGTTALSAAALLTVNTAMRSQTGYNDTNKALGASNLPRILLIPNELIQTAWLIQNSSVNTSANQDDTEPNFFRNQFQRIIVVDDWTDANDWYVVADPRMVPTLEVGFLGGREEPELFVQDQPTVGSVFNADKVTYKIRHIYGIGILDHRGFYRQAVA